MDIQRIGDELKQLSAQVASETATLESIEEVVKKLKFVQAEMLLVRFQKKRQAVRLCNEIELKFEELKKILEPGSDNEEGLHSQSTNNDFDPSTWEYKFTGLPLPKEFKQCYGQIVDKWIETGRLNPRLKWKKQDQTMVTEIIDLIRKYFPEYSEKEIKIKLQKNLSSRRLKSTLKQRGPKYKVYSSSDANDNECLPTPMDPSPITTVVVPSVTPEMIFDSDIENVDIVCNDFPEPFPETPVKKTRSKTPRGIDKNNEEERESPVQKKKPKYAPRVIKPVLLRDDDPEPDPVKSAESAINNIYEHFVYFRMPSPERL